MGLRFPPSRIRGAITRRGGSLLSRGPAQAPAVEIEDPPCDCPEIMPGFYATFFYDPDGMKLEVTYTL
jgi:hypothetical protein